jgi:hypothetical protein
MFKKGLFIFLAISFLILNLYSASALSIDNKQDEYVSVMPNQKVCIMRNITLDKDKSVSYLMAISDKASVDFKTATSKEVQVAETEPIAEPIEGLKGNLITENPVIDAKPVKLNPYNSESLTKTFTELSAVADANTQIVELPQAETSQVEVCFQMPDFESLKQEKSGELSFCIYQQNDLTGDYISDCEHSVWWNFAYGYRQKVIFFSNKSEANVSTSVQIAWNDYMKTDFSDITWTSQNDSNNFSETEEAFYLQSKADEQYAIYQLNLFMNCANNVSGICNQTHYFYYNANIDNSDKSCYTCIRGQAQGSVTNLWHFNENTGTTINDACGTKNGTINDANWITGKFNWGLNFDGINDFVIVGSSISKPTTISIWFDYDTIGTSEMPIEYGWNSGDYKLFGIVWTTIGSNQLLLVTRTSGADYRYYRIALETDLSSSWNNVVVVWEGTTKKAYLNGVERNLTIVSQAGSETNANDLLNTDVLEIGRGEQGGFYYYDGALDEIALFNKSITQIEVEEYYTTELTCFKSLTSFNYTIFEPEPRPIYINCEYNENPYLESKIDLFCTIQNAINDDFKCNSFVYFENNTLISASPSNQYIEGVGNINYFQALPKLADTQIANIELNTRDFTEQQLIAKVVCISNNNHRVTFTRYITPQYRELVQVGDVTKHLTQNIGFYIGFFLIGLVLVFFIAMFMNWTGLEQYAKPFFVIALVILLFVAIITYLIQST